MKDMLKKKSEGMDPLKKEAKLAALKNLREEMSALMQDDIGGKMNKVTIAAKDKEGLKQGLEKAEEILDASPKSDSEELAKKEEEMGMDLDEDMELGESEEHQEKVTSNMSEEEIDQMMQKLMEMKKKLKG